MVVVAVCAAAPGGEKVAAKVRVVGAHAHAATRGSDALPSAARTTVASGAWPAGAPSNTVTRLPGTPVRRSDTRPMGAGVATIAGAAFWAAEAAAIASRATAVAPRLRRSMAGELLHRGPAHRRRPR